MGKDMERKGKVMKQKGLVNQTKRICFSVLTLMLLWSISIFAYASEENREYIPELQALLPDEPVESTLEDEIFRGRVNLPDVYDSREEGIITPVKQQGIYGTCWAFSALSMLESSALRQNIMSGQEADLSERHLAYYTFYPVAEELGGTWGDRTIYTRNDMSFLDLGGNVNMAGRTLAGWQGAVVEEEAPYAQILQRLPADVQTAYKNDRIHLKNNFIINKGDMDLIKESIMKYGSASISYYSSSAYFNSAENSQYCPGSVSANHAVTLVGWDDNYPAEKFSIKPDRNGAWLVKNSWGDEWGNDGYFWLSYSDRSIGTNVYVMEADSADNYDNNYQYDGTILDDIVFAGMEETRIANVFQTRANPYGAEEIKAISFAPYTVNLEYSIQIYSDLMDKNDPESGTPALTVPQSGMTQSAGYYTISLEETVVLPEGRDFSVVITLKKPGNEIRLYTEGTKAIGGGAIQSVAAAGEGESFLFEGRAWADYGRENSRNLRIKAFTDNVSQDKLPVPTQTPTPEPLPFRDVNLNDWNYEYVEYVYLKSIMIGVTNNQFKPGIPLTRSMFATILYRLESCPEVVYKNRFPDVPAGTWYSDAVEWTVNQRIADGFPDGRFGPDENITREQMAKMLHRYAQLKENYVSGSTNLSGFKDAKEVGGWALEGIKWAVGTGIINGAVENHAYYLKPHAYASRAECAAMIKRFMEQYAL